MDFDLSLIIDNYSGEDYRGVFDEFLYLNKYDYVDFLEFGFDKKLLKGFGFELCSENLYVPQKVVVKTSLL